MRYGPENESLNVSTYCWPSSDYWYTSQLWDIPDLSAPGQIKNRGAENACLDLSGPIWIVACDTASPGQLFTWGDDHLLRADSEFPVRQN